MYCPTCGEPAGEGANFCGRCGLKLEPLSGLLGGGRTAYARDAAPPDATRGDLPALGLSVKGLAAVEALWAGVCCTSPGKVNVSRRDVGGGREYMRFFLRESCLQITCSRMKTHVARDLSRGRKVGEIFDRRALGGSLFFDTIEGTTCLLYADAFAHPGREASARLLAESDGGQFERFRAELGSHACPERGRTIAAIYEGGRIISAAVYEMRDECVARLFAATLPKFRRRGLASECVVGVAREAFKSGLILEYRAEKEDAASTGLARRLGLAPFGEMILITFKGETPSPLLRASELQLSTPTQTINEILSSSSNREAREESYGESAAADARAVADIILSLPWYGSVYRENRSRFESECRSMFPWISEEAVDVLHSAYAGGWIP